MSPEVALPFVCLLLAMLVGMPALAARQRRQLSQAWSDVAVELTAFASEVRRAGRCLPVDENLLQRLRGLGIPELTTFELVCQLRNADSGLLAEAARRLALRLKRRAAFERKMLARTAPGRRRGAVAAAAPAVVLLLANAGGAALPVTALALLVLFEALGCWMLWRVARVDV
jgi:Flp pilus assembly protein TadB